MTTTQPISTPTSLTHGVVNESRSTKASLSSVIAPDLPLCTALAHEGSDSALRRFFDRWHSSIDDTNIRIRILHHLQDDVQALLDLRPVSRAFKEFVQPAASIAFETIYLHYALPPSVPKLRKHVSNQGLKNLLSLPRTLVLTIHPVSSAKGMGREAEWRTLSSLFANLTKLKKLAIVLGHEMDALVWEINPEGAGRPLWLYAWPNHLLAKGDLATPAHTHSLLELRHALTMCNAPELFELELRNWTISACMLLRDRPFHMFTDPDTKQVPSTANSPCMFWRRIRKLEATMVKWWRIPSNPVDQQLYRDGSEMKATVEKSSKLSSAMAERVRHNNLRDQSVPTSPTVSPATLELKGELIDLRHDGIRVLHDFVAVFSRGIHHLEWKWVQPVVVSAGNPKRYSTITRLEIQRCTGMNPTTLEMWNKGIWWRSAPLSFPKLRSFKLYDVAVSNDMVKKMAERMNALERFVTPLKNLNVKTGLGDAYMEDDVAYAVLNLSRGGRLFKDTREVMGSRARYRERMEQTARELNLF